MKERFMVSIDGGEAVVRALLSEGVETIYELPGWNIMNIYDSLYKTGKIRHITVKHEVNAAIMADVYGRLTGEPGICLTTAGPGATNIATGVATAYNAASPMIHISGAEFGDGRYGYFHGMDDPLFLERVFQALTKWSVVVERVEDIPFLLAKAFRIAKEGRPGPVHLEIPWNILDSYGEVGEYKGEKPLSPILDRGLIEDVVKRILKAEAPLIYVGEGVLRSFAWRELLELAEILHAPVITTPLARSAFPNDHPLFAGIIYADSPYSNLMEYAASNPVAIELLRETDLALSIGVRSGTPEADLSKAIPLENLIWIDLEENKFIWEYRVEANLVGNIRDILRSIIPELKGKGGRASTKDPIKRIEGGRLEVERRLMEEISNRDRRPIHPGLVLHKLQDLLDRDAILASDVGMIQVWVNYYCKFYEANTHLYGGSYGSMGFSLPAAIAAKLLFPHRQVIAVTGDGAFLMSMMELATAMENRADIVVIILNDSKYNAIWHQQEIMYGGRHIATDISPVNFAECAQAFGAKGVRVEEPSELSPALEEAFTATVPTVIDVVIDHRPRFFLDQTFTSLKRPIQP